MCVFRKEIDVEDTNMILMNLDNGVRACYLQCHFAPDIWRNYTFIGTEGRLENVNGESKITVLTRRSNTWREYAHRTYDVKPPTEGGHGGADPADRGRLPGSSLYRKSEIADPSPPGWPCHRGSRCRVHPEQQQISHHR